MCTIDKCCSLHVPRLHFCLLPWCPVPLQQVICTSDSECKDQTCGVHPQRWADGSYKGGVTQGSCGEHVAWVSFCCCCPDYNSSTTVVEVAGRGVTVSCVPVFVVVVLRRPRPLRLLCVYTSVDGARGDAECWTHRPVVLL